MRDRHRRSRPRRQDRPARSSRWACRRERQRRGVAQDGLGFRGRLPSVPLSISPRQHDRGALASLSALSQDPDRGSLGRGMHRQNIDAAESSRRAPPARSAGRRRARSRSGCRPGAAARAAAAHHAASVSRRRHVRQRAAPRRASADAARRRLKGGFISTRSTIRRRAPRPRRRGRRRRRRACAASNAIRQRVARGVLAPRAQQSAASISTRVTRDVRDAPREREAGEPDAGAEFDDVLARRRRRSRPQAARRRGRSDGRGAAATAAAGRRAPRRR